MVRFAILLGGALAVTPRLLDQIGGARAIAADGGMAHADALGLTPELWVGDFDSADDALSRRHAAVPRKPYPADKDATDGELAIAEAVRAGADELVLAGGLGGQADHMLGHFGLALREARAGRRVVITSGREEAWPVLPGRTTIDARPGWRFSLLPLSDLAGVGLTGVKWPLEQRTVPLGSTLTVSNVATGPVGIELTSGHAMAFLYPLG